MNNETIVRMYPRPDPKNMECALDLARADEREKIKNQMLDGVMTDSEFEEYTGSKRDQPQGVDVWVSWDSGVECNPVIANKEPIISEQIGVYYHSGNGLVATEIFEGFARLLNISPGECKKFRIVEVVG